MEQSKLNQVLTKTVLAVLESRYLLRDENGKVVETPAQMFRRVADNIAIGDKIYGSSEDEVAQTAQRFLELMNSFKFLPNSPTLMNAGKQLQQLSACFVIPIGDSLADIFTALKDAALVQQSGGGTGFSFSLLREKGSPVSTTRGTASGPLSFMKIFNIATEVIKQGGARKGANMGILRVDHPDIVDFIKIKENEKEMTNFNLSVGITDSFMRAVDEDAFFSLVSPRGGNLVRKVKAREIFRLIAEAAWKSGEPGIVFLDRINASNPTPALGEIDSTNPCGEQPLLPYESCNLGSLNLSKFITCNDGKNSVDFKALETAIREAVHFLDNVIDLNNYPLPQIKQITTGNRKIGLGVMGFADLLIRLGIPYDSEECLLFVRELMGFIQGKAKAVSAELAKKRGNFPNYCFSVFGRDNLGPMRNATVTTIAPTGTISLIAGCSSGIEPLFALAYSRRVLGCRELFYLNPFLEQSLREKGLYSQALLQQIFQEGSLQGIDGIPEETRRVFVTAHDISPEWHVRVQAAFQQFVDNGVSKTVNLPREALIEDVLNVYQLAYELGCKGITVYRDGSREEQVLIRGGQETCEYC
jgi:ribonucleoside-diphosphate reductase alpha chain